MRTKNQNCVSLQHTSLRTETEALAVHANSANPRAMVHDEKINTFAPNSMWLTSVRIHRKQMKSCE